VIARAIIIGSLERTDQRTRAILAGKANERAREAGSDEDPDLVDDERELGKMWARANHANDPGECPRHSAAFTLGCQAYVESRPR